MSLPGAWQDHLAALAACQPWPRYYHFRAGEMEVAAALCRLPRGETMLELGCGNAFHSYLLAGRFQRVIATDLAKPDPGTHTIGLDRARRLGEILGVDNLRLVAASAAALPLADETVDFVFSSNVLEHVREQEQAVAEIRRVLRPGGRSLTIVPAAMERVYNFPVSYAAIVHGMLKGLRRHAAADPPPSNGRGPGLGGGEAAGGSLAGRARRFLGRHYPTFPFPKPHGEYPSSTAEMLAHRTSRWRRLFTSGGLEIERTFTTILAPHNLGLAFSFGTAYWIARAGWPLTRRLGALPGFRALGTSFALMARRPGGGAA